MTTAHTMTNNVSDYSTDDLFRMLGDEEQYGDDFNYDATWCLFKRWRHGTDLEPLIQLLGSEKINERLRGAWYLEESAPPADGIIDAAIKLAGDPLGYCRWAFASYVLSARAYSPAIAKGMAACLLDLDLYVRGRTIFWATLTSDENFRDFSELFASGFSARNYKFSNPRQTEHWRQSEHKRAARGIMIATRLRAEEPLEDIRRSMPEEDNHIFDELEFSRSAIQRGIDRRKKRRFHQS